MKYQYVKLFWWTVIFTVITVTIILVTKEEKPKKYSKFQVVSTKQIVLIEDTIYNIGDTVELDKGACACRVSDNWGNENNVKAIKIK